MKYRVKTDLLEDMGKGDEISSSWRDRMIQEGAPESWFEPVEQVTEGQYWKWHGENEYMFRIQEVYPETKRCDILYPRTGAETQWYINGITEDARKLSTHEIESALIKEAKRRGFREGVTIKPLSPQCEEYKADKIGVIQSYDDYDDSLDTECGCRIYCKGRWAEIVDQTPHIEINGYEAEFHDEYVKFGCAKIPVDHILQLNEQIGHLNRPEAYKESVNGFKLINGVKIGEGIFTIGQIKEIAEYYE